MRVCVRARMCVCACACVRVCVRVRVRVRVRVLVETIFYNVFVELFFSFSLFSGGTSDDEQCDAGFSGDACCTAACRLTSGSVCSDGESARVYCLTLT